MARYSLFVLKVPLNPKQTNKLPGHHPPGPQRKHNLRAMTECYNRFHMLDEIDRTDDPDTE